MARSLVAALLIGGISNATAQTAPSTPALTRGSTELRITAGNGFQQLRFGDQAIAEGEAITTLGEIRNGQDAATVFAVKPRGGPCPGGVIVIAARGGAPARFDRRLIDDCNGFTLARSTDRLLLIGLPSPAYAGSLWQVTPGEGLRLIGATTFAPEPGSDFSSLTSETALPPAATVLLRNQAVFTAFQRLTGPDFKAYAGALSTQDRPVDAAAPLLAAAGCSAADECGRTAALLIVDPDRRTVYVALRQGGRISAKPDISSWSPAGKVALANWQARFR